MNKAQLTGKNTYERGMSTLEILMAFAILILCISAVIMVAFGNQSVAVDLETNNEAISKAQALLEQARATSRQNYGLVEECDDSGATSCLGTLDPFYTRKITIDPAFVTQCAENVKSSTNWTIGGRTLSVDFVTRLGDIATVLGLGGDCLINPPGTNWDSPDRFASDTFSPGKPTTIDVLNKIAYLGLDKAPFLVIADTTGAYLGQDFSDPLFLPFANGFNLGATPNSIDVIKWNDPLGGFKNYAFLAMNTATDQLKVVDVTDIANPVLKATIPLSPCVTGAAPQGWRLYAYKDRLYFLTRYTAGPEFHIFDISNPISPSEIGAGACKGFELGDTAESIEVRDQAIGGSTIRFVYLATDEVDKELRVLDVTNPLAITNVNTATQDLPGAQDGQSVYIVGNKLYFGRQSTPGGPDLYVFNITDPTISLPLLGSQDIGTGVIAIRVAGPLSFLETPKVNKEFQVWNISNLGSIFLIKEYNFGNVVSQGIDYEYDFVYATGQATPNFQILYDSTP